MEKNLWVNRLDLDGQSANDSNLSKLGTYLKNRGTKFVRMTGELQDTQFCDSSKPTVFESKVAALTP